MGGRVRAIGYTNFKNRAMERIIDLPKLMGDHLNKTHHLHVGHHGHHHEHSEHHHGL